MKSEIHSIEKSPAYKLNDIDGIFQNNSNVFDIRNLPERIIIEGKAIPLNNRNEEAQHIYKVMLLTLQSDWFRELSKKSQKQFFPVYRNLFNWISSYQVTPFNRFMILKDYESYRVNECEVKPQSTGLGHIINLMKVGMSADTIDPETLRYINLLLVSTTPSLPEEKVQYTLTGYFTEVHWLRSMMEEKDYLRLESPKRLMDSFSITIATTLLFILKEKKKASEYLKIESKKNYLNKEINYKSKIDLWCRNIFFDLYSTDHVISELLRIDFMIDEYFEDTCNQVLEFRNGNSKNKGVKIKINGTYKKSYSMPDIFHYNNVNTHSKIEQILFSWLCAWLCIQPEDIKKLKKNNFLIHRNNTGHPSAVQCQYYKGRGGKEYETPLISAKQIEGECILEYLSTVIDSNSPILTNMSMARLTDTSRSTPANRMKQIWKSKIIINEIENEIRKRSSSLIFIKAFQCLLDNATTSYGAWRKSRELENLECSTSTYRATIEKPLPDSMFGHAAIKNSSVHSRTDIYREGDLNNQNSHSSATEGLHYLSDSNKEWINQKGRLSRIVMNDMKNFIYKPNLNKSIQAANDLILRTEIIEDNEKYTSNNKAIKTNGMIEYDFTIGSLYPDSIVVIDSVETVINMLHYINEADRQRLNLIDRSLSFFELTVLPTAEWMSYVLSQKISPDVVRNGKIKYEEIKSILPNLFLAELNSGITA